MLCRIARSDGNVFSLISHFIVICVDFSVPGFCHLSHRFPVRIHMFDSGAISVGCGHKGFDLNNLVSSGCVKQWIPVPRESF